MRSRPITILAVAALGLLLAAMVAEAHTLDSRRARPTAERLAARQADRGGFAQHEITGPFRLDSHRLVWGWYAERADGTACVAQLVVRFRSSSTRRTRGYFRNRICD